MNKNIYYSDKKISVGTDISEDTLNQTIVFNNQITELSLKNAIQQFLISEEGNDLFIQSDNFEKILHQIKSEFYFIEAAGGLIRKNDTYLFIKRLGKWDLPKGKLDKDESNEKAAIRECEEECAVKELKIQNALPNSYHIYPYKKGFALKVTYWFYMTTDFDQELIPQTEENIEEVKWFTIEEITNLVLKNTYVTIKELLFHFFKW